MYTRSFHSDWVINTKIGALTMDIVCARTSLLSVVLGPVQ